MRRHQISAPNVGFRAGCRNRRRTGRKRAPLADDNSKRPIPITVPPDRASQRRGSLSGTRESNMNLSESARALWAKSGAGDDWHPLIAHLLDVAACARAILEREPPSTLTLYAADLGLDEPQALAWVCALAG